MSVFTALTFDLNKKTTDVTVGLAGLDILTITFKESNRGAGDGVPIDERAVALSCLVSFLPTFAMSIQGPRGIEALQRVRHLKGRMDMASRLGRVFCLRKQEAAAKRRLPERWRMCLTKTL